MKKSLASKDYNAYLKSQVVRAESKWGRKSAYNEVFKRNLRQSWKQIEHLIGDPRQICCMGVRDGTELFEFKEYYPNAEVHGTDITENIKTIKLEQGISVSLQDFNNLPEDWENKYDLVFSNSLDHAFSPKETIKEWHRVIRKDGRLFVQLSTTKANNIEHEFEVRDLSPLFPGNKFLILKAWISPAENVINGLFKVIK